MSIVIGNTLIAGSGTQPDNNTISLNQSGLLETNAVMSEQNNPVGVWSGTKDEYDNIYQANYTRIGSVIVDKEGIAQNLIYPNEIILNLDNTLNSYKFEMKNVHVMSSWVLSYDQSAFKLYFNGSGACQALARLNNNWESIAVLDCGNYTDFDFYFEFTGTKYIFGVKGVDRETYTTGEYTSSTKVSNNKIIIGDAEPTTIVDLSQAFITSNGTEVYRAYIKPDKSKYIYNITDKKFRNLVPTTKSETLTIGSSGSTYIAPADGWFTFRTEAVVVTSFWNNSKNIGNTAYSTSGFAGFNLVPACKGDTVVFRYSNSSPSNTLRFIYSESEE